MSCAKAFAAISFFIILIGCESAIPITNGDEPRVINWEYQNRHNNGYGPKCEFSGRFTPRSECENVSAPTTIIWGDSVAMYWVSALLGSDIYQGGLIQATMSTCGPVLRASPVYTEYYDEKWARKCLEFNDDVFEYIKNTPSISHVIMSGIFLYYVEPGQYLLTEKSRERQGIETASAYLLATIDQLKKIGKTVTLIAPAPIANFDVGACYAQQYPHTLPAAQPSDCSISVSEYHKDSGDVIELLHRVGQQSGVKVVWPADILCDAITCRTNLGGVPLYRDRTHLSYAGSQAIGRAAEFQRLLSPQ